MGDKIWLFFLRGVGGFGKQNFVVFLHGVGGFKQQIFFLTQSGGFRKQNFAYLDSCDTPGNWDVDMNKRSPNTLRP